MDINQILNSLKAEVGQNSLELPAGIDSKKVISIASESVLNSFSKQAGNGDVSGIMEMFSGTETSTDNPVMAGIGPDIIKQLSEKLGIDSSTASGITSKLLPLIMNAFNQKSSSGGFDFNSVIGSFQNEGIGDLIKNVIGDQSPKEGSSPKSGGLMDLFKGLFGK